MGARGGQYCALILIGVPRKAPFAVKVLIAPMVDLDPNQVFELIPHDGSVFLDPLPGAQPAGQVLTHVETQQKIPLPANESWTLAFDETGYGALVEDGTEVVRLLEDCLTKSSMRSEEGESLVFLRENRC